MSEVNVDCWIRVDEAAMYMDVTKDTMQNWIKKDAIPTHKTGELWKLKQPKLDA